MNVCFYFDIIFMEKWYDNYSFFIYLLNKVMLIVLLDCVVLNEDISVFIEVKNSFLFFFFVRLRILWCGVLCYVYI